MAWRAGPSPGSQPLSGLERGLRYRTFIAYNAAGGIAWGTTFVLIGYAAGTSYTKVASTIGIYSLAIVGIVVAAVLALIVIGGARGPPGSRQERWARTDPADEAVTARISVRKA